jgi:hypothetical protein
MNPKPDIKFDTQVSLRRRSDALSPKNWTFSPVPWQSRHAMIFRLTALFCDPRSGFADFLLSGYFSAP